MEYGKQQLRLTIKKSSKGTYFIQSMRMKDLRRIAKRHKKRWRLSDNEETLILEGEQTHQFSAVPRARGSGAPRAPKAPVLP